VFTRDEFTKSDWKIFIWISWRIVLCTTNHATKVTPSNNSKVLRLLHGLSLFYILQITVLLPIKFTKVKLYKLTIHPIWKHSQCVLNHIRACPCYLNFSVVDQRRNYETIKCIYVFTSRSRTLRNWMSKGSKVNLHSCIM
jgi:hypothetical protein